jgi:transformation/transcription domain-associated protein
VSYPSNAVDEAHAVLQHILSLNIDHTKSEERQSNKSYLSKDLLQTCIRPVLLHLRDYTKLTVPLLRGLSRLLSLLSSWFNKTLGEKLLDHLQKWTDPSKIISHKIWKEGEEILVAAAIVEIFPSLPHAYHFVEHLVKTCIKLEAALPTYRVAFVESPFRRPLARYLNKHPEYAVSFFFPRLKTPMYSELFQSVLQLEDSVDLRKHLCGKQCSLMILNICFERPLAIIRAEKNLTPGGSAKTSLHTHGIGKETIENNEKESPRPMTTEGLELQSQGFRLIETLMADDENYFHEHNDIVRAFRWLWRSKGRSLRLQHEDTIPPRYRDESKVLANFLITYAKSFRNDDLDILFELFRVFLQPSTTSFAFVSKFLIDMVTQVLSVEQKRRVLERFFVSIAGDANEEIKVLGIQFLVFPMLAAEFKRASQIGDDPLIDNSVVEKFVKEIMFNQGIPISCGDRLKVEILRLTYLFVEFRAIDVEPYKKEIVKYCWGLMKSEDTPCKCWAYVVLCRFIAAFDTPIKIVHQVYVALLRCHQQDGRELIRVALDLLVPSLKYRLPSEEQKKIVDLTSQMMLEEGQSTPQLAHICHTIVRNPEIFPMQNDRFVKYLINCLNRLGLSPNCPHENRILAIDMVERLLALDYKQDGSINFPDQMETICNFLVRLKLVMAEASADAKITPRIEFNALRKRITVMLDHVISRWNPTIRVEPLEKLASEDMQTAGFISSCLDVLHVATKFKQNYLFTQNLTLMQEIVSAAFRVARKDKSLQEQLQDFVVVAKDFSSLTQSFLIVLEKIIDEAKRDLQSTPAAGRMIDSNRSRGNQDRAGGRDEAFAIERLGLYAVETIAKLCENKPCILTIITPSLLSYAAVLSKVHLLEATAKQRQGSSSAPRASAPGHRYHTPTVGILEESCSQDHLAAPKLSLNKTRPHRDDIALTPALRSLVIILSAFESSSIVYSFTPERKTLLHILCSILESSNSVQVLMATVRLVGKWLLEDNIVSPLTPKEKSSFLGRISGFDSTCFSSDIAAQPLVELVNTLASRLCACTKTSCEEGVEKLTLACLLNPNYSSRHELMNLFVDKRLRLSEKNESTPSTGMARNMLWLLFHCDFDGIGSRYCVTVFVDVFLRHLHSEQSDLLLAVATLAHGDVILCYNLFCNLMPSAWNDIQDDRIKVLLISSFESFISKPYHSQFLRAGSRSTDPRSSNSVRTFINAFLSLKPVPVISIHLLVASSENYNCWYEVLSFLEQLYHASEKVFAGNSILSGMRLCHRRLNDDYIWLHFARESCSIVKSQKAISLDVYGMIREAMNEYSELVDLVDTPGTTIAPTDFEIDMWEERWVQLQKELFQKDVVSEFADLSGNPKLQLECAWKAQDWSRVRSLCSSTAFLPEIENGDPNVKMSETLLAVADGKLTDVENLHAQTAQLCLYKWQLLPQLSSGSMAHSSLLHFFHRLVEIRESGQIMVETNNHAKKRSLPDLKNLLNAWRHRLPNDYEPLSVWDEIFAWRTHMFNAITSNFSWCDPEQLATLHDRPWTTIRMAKTARKQGMRDVALLILNNAVDEKAMNVSDAFLKLREQVLAYYNPESNLECHGGLNLINTTNLSFFDASQKSELFRLKATFLHSLQGRGKANKAFCHAVQICPTHARAWDSWGELCTSLSVEAEKQHEREITSGGSEANKDAKISGKNVPKYLAQAMGCYIEAVMIDAHEWARIHIPKCLWMLTKDVLKEGTEDVSLPGLLASTLESQGSHLPAWVWLPWIPQLLTSLYRREARAIRTIFAKLVKAYPQAVYYPIRAYYLERRDVDRLSQPPAASQSQASVAHAEELMSLLRRSHASLWTTLESILEELIVKFRPSFEEEFLATILVLLERVETQVGSIGKQDEEGSIVLSVWKTLHRIAAKFFRSTDPDSIKHDRKAKKTAEFKEAYRAKFEEDFKVSSLEQVSAPPEPEVKPEIVLSDIIKKLRSWKETLEEYVITSSNSFNMIESSHSLAMFGVGETPDLWPGSCDSRYASQRISERVSDFDTDPGTTQSSTSSSATAARKAANNAATIAISAAKKEGVGGDFGGGSSFTEIPGQYVPNTSSWSDARPSPELHAKLVRFEPVVEVLRRNDALVRRVGMLGSDGNVYYFLLQFAIPYLTRTDERTSQTHYVIDKCLRRGMQTSRAPLSLQPHTVIPVAQRLRLIGEPKSRNSLEDVYRFDCLKNQKNSSELSNRFNNELIERFCEKRNIGEHEERLNTEKSIRLDIFSRICSSEEVDSSLLLHYLSTSLGGPEQFYHFRRVFAQQWAANCLLQYSFSAAERTPARVVFVESNGRVLAPEFRISYNNQGCFENHHVPFRLTENISQVIGFPLLHGTFITTMSMIARAINDGRDDLDPIFRLLLRDDLIAYYTKSMAKSDVKTVEMERQLTESVRRNVATLHTRFKECSFSSGRARHESNNEQPIDEKVRKLVEAAQDRENLCMMPGRFQGWL